MSDPILRARTSVQVQGPFYAPAGTAVKNYSQQTMCVASGIGITPFFSVMATRVAEEASYEADKQVYQSMFGEELASSRGASSTTMKNLQQIAFSADTWMSDDNVKVLHVVWSIRDVSELMFYLDYVYELVKQQNGLKKPVVMVDVFITGIGKHVDITYMMSQTLFLLTLGAKTSRYMKIHFSRPDMKKIINDLKPQQVYYCGGAALKTILGNVCMENKITFHPEDFDSGTTVLKDVIGGVKKGWETVSDGCKKSTNEVSKEQHREEKRVLRQKSMNKSRSYKHRNLYNKQADSMSNHVEMVTGPKGVDLDSLIVTDNIVDETA